MHAGRLLGPPQPTLSQTTAAIIENLPRHGHPCTRSFASDRHLTHVKGMRGPQPTPPVPTATTQSAPKEAAPNKPSPINGPTASARRCLAFAAMQTRKAMTLRKNQQAILLKNESST